jgi:hypothetical protein
VLLVLCTTDPATGIEFATVSRVRFIKAAWLARSFGCGGRMIGPANVPLETVLKGRLSLFGPMFF